MSPRRRNLDAPEALLEAARAEFGRRGLDGARVEDITRRAGLSKGAFYLHFRSKEEAFQVLLQRLLGALEALTIRRAADEEELQREIGAPSPADITRANRRYQIWLERETAWDTELLEIVWRNRHIVAAVDGLRPASRLLQEFRRRVSELVEHSLRSRRAAGQVRADLDPQAVADVIVGSYEAFARRMVDLPEKPDLAAWARSVLVLFYRGVVAGPAAAPARPPARRS